MAVGSLGMATLLAALGAGDIHVSGIACETYEEANRYVGFRSVYRDRLPEIEILQRAQRDPDPMHCLPAQLTLPSDTVIPEDRKFSFDGEQFAIIGVSPTPGSVEQEVTFFIIKFDEDPPSSPLEASAP